MPKLPRDQARCAAIAVCGFHQSPGDDGAFGRCLRLLRRPAGARSMFSWGLGLTEPHLRARGLEMPCALDKIDPKELAQDTAAVAALTWILANQ